MQHLAMIMDGNRRWAKEQKFKAVTQGHRHGVESVKTAIEFCLKKGIRYLSLFTFSLENFKREESEQIYIFKLLVSVLEKNVFNLIEQGVRIRFVGDREQFPENVLNAIGKVEEKTKHLDALGLNMLFCYGGRQELSYAVKQIARKVKAGELDPEAIDEDVLRGEFWSAGIPDPDLIIRTGRQSRLSNFFLFQAAYSEIKFLDCYWPEITQERLSVCYDEFLDSQRNFGV